MSVDDVLLLGADWPTRALLRAQLIESGIQVFATDTWASARQHLLRSGVPRVCIVDLHGLADATSVLRELGSVMPLARVIVLGETATAAPKGLTTDVRILARPISIGAVVDTALQMLNVQQQRRQGGVLT